LEPAMRGIDGLAQSGRNQHLERISDEKLSGCLQDPMDTGVVCGCVRGGAQSRFAVHSTSVKLQTDGVRDRVSE